MRGVAVAGARHLEGPVEGLAGAVGQVVDERDVADLDQVDLRLALVGEDPAEQHQEHQREDDREEHRRPVAQKPRLIATARLQKARTPLMRGTPAR